MTDRSIPTQPAELVQAQAEGRRQGMATAALALGLVSFLNLLGAEKAILAIVLALLAMSGSTSRIVRQRSRFAIALALLYILTIVLVLGLYHDQLSELLRLLTRLG